MRNNILLLISCFFVTSVFAQPAIHSFEPASGPVGATVTIKGIGFSTTAANNIIYFGAVKSSPSSSTDTTITVTVPAGATYQPITVTTNNLTAYSVHPFIVTFAGNDDPFSST